MDIDADASVLTVELNERSYDIVIGEGLIAEAAKYVAPLLNAPKCFIVTDENLVKTWLGPFEQSLSDAGIPFATKVLPAGEETKSFAYLEELTGWLLDQGIDRKTTLIALGGGVIGDLTGFVAAVTLRGLPFIQIPTTLLAQVDSSVGGKTAIDMPQGKNLVGAFHQPKLVLADTATLDTLPHRQVLAGYAEVVKYGMIVDADFFSWCEANAAALIDGDPAARRHAIEASCRVKAAIVAEDERESGRRALLNLGHTFGHAFEAELGYSDTLLHGEAVALGCVTAFELSKRMEYCSGQDSERVRAHIKNVGLPATLAGIATDAWTPDLILGHMAKDKKVESGTLTFVLARAIGDAFTSRDVDPNVLRKLLSDILKP